MRDDRRNPQLLERLKDTARAEVQRDGVLSCNTAIELADNGIDPDTLQDELQSQYC
jgi:hypothetical protein